MPPSLLWTGPGEAIFDYHPAPRSCRNRLDLPESNRSLAHSDSRWRIVGKTGNHNARRSIGVISRLRSSSVPVAATEATLPGARSSEGLAAIGTRWVFFKPFVSHPRLRSSYVTAAFKPERCGRVCLSALCQQIEKAVAQFRRHLEFRDFRVASSACRPLTLGKERCFLLHHFG